MAEKKVENNIKLDKRKGQYILKDEQIIKRQIDYAGLKGHETVLEIGPGLGALTFKLANKAKQVIAIEKDPRLFSYLKERIPKNVELINADVMKIAIPRFDVVVSNLPYQISSPVTFKLLDSKFERAILMYQKEFAERMVAKAGDSGYSRLSVNVYYKADCRILEAVPKEAFSPVPEVDGAIIELIPRPSPFYVKSEKMFFNVVEVLFNQRRKKIKNPLMSFVAKEMKNRGNYSKSAVISILQNLPFMDNRVESLSPEDIARLVDELYVSIVEN
ncbi:MAG: ribosomal RNA small subunit methyltransferase A [Methanomassiliicoccales archaeon]|nr:MAG: ribosomal RNA small subunit methyltransferase A [Methanomassiliicoccales archaeon]